jgi:thymidylate synthase ThyX
VSKYTFHLAFTDWGNGKLSLSPEYSDKEGRDQNLIDMEPSLEEVEVEDELVFKYLKDCEDYYLKIAKGVRDFKECLSSALNPKPEEDE